MQLQINPPTLILMRGLPRSGKSTLARSMGYPIVSPDSFRHVMHGTSFFKGAEALVWAIVRTTVMHYFDYGYEKVILDYCNNTKRRIDVWRDGPWTIEIVTVNTSEEECIKRAYSNGRKDLVPEIQRMAQEQDFQRKPELG
jgi:predicted kinase